MGGSSVGRWSPPRSCRQSEQRVREREEGEQSCPYWGGETQEWQEQGTDWKGPLGVVVWGFPWNPTGRVAEAV